MTNSIKGSVKPYALHTAPQIAESTSTSELLDSAFYVESRQWFIKHLGIDVELVRNDPAFWLGMSVGTHLDKARADLGFEVRT